VPPGQPPFAQPAPQPSNGIAIAGLILAFLIPPIGLILSIIGLVKSGRAGRRGVAVAGLVIGLVLTLAVGGIAYVVATKVSSALDPGCGTAQSAVTDNATKIASAATFKDAAQATIDGLTAAESKATHDDVRNAIKALKDDYTQLVAAATAGDLAKVTELQPKLTTDANAFDALCPVDLRK
jgi:predicted lipid-binding transport protein (Tim44 family)